MNKFKVGDVVVRTEFLQDFPYYTSPQTVSLVHYDGDIQLENDFDYCYYCKDYFELYQPEQPEVKPQVQPMQPLVSIYDKALDLRFEHNVLGDVSLREFYCNVLCNAVVNGEEIMEDVLPTEVLNLLIQNDLAGMPEVDAGIYDVSKAGEFVSKMIAHAFGCIFNKE